jgi:diguanylate cyclase (GGDEF)-like protein
LSFIAWSSSLVCLAYLFVLATIAVLLQHKAASYYLGGITAIIAGVLVVILRNQGFIDDNTITITIPAVAALFGLTLFSVSVSINIQEDNRHKYIDPITDLFNSVYFFERLENEFDIAFHQQHSLCLLLINIDKLTESDQSTSSFINNRLVKNVAYQTEKNLRKNHIAARFNRDEFVVILPDTPKQSAKIIAERIRITIEENTSTTVSIGIGCYNSNDKTNCISDHKELLESTDKAMYRAKKYGGNIIQMYSDQDPEGN